MGFMPSTQLLSELSNFLRLQDVFALFHGSGPGWLLAALFVYMIPKMLSGAAEVIKALAELSKARR
jgi:hypothetical protein